jgi:hypothetical protein
VADPYRRRPDDPKDTPDERRPALASLGFGLICAVLSVSLAEHDRVKCMLFATAAGTFLIASRREP